MAITSTAIREVCGESDAQALYSELRRTNDFVGFARRFVIGEKDYHIARKALWVLTKATNQELMQLQETLSEMMELAMQTPNSTVRRLSLNIIDRLRMDEEDLRSDFLDFCLEHMTDVDEYPGIQTLCMKQLLRMGQIYPELMSELCCTLETMKIEFYKPAVRSLRNKILGGRKK